MSLALLGQRSRRISANRAQQVVLACATFDADGRLMVTPEGLLPCQKITDSYIESFNEVFTVDHNVFCWIFRASRCWKAITDLLPAMRSHLQHAHTKANSNSYASHCGNRADEYAIMFKELFCVAANDLAASIQTPFENLGVLFERIMSTGTLGRNHSLDRLKGALNIVRTGSLPRNPTVNRLKRLLKEPNRLDSIEKGQSIAVLGRGQLLFVVRRVDRYETVRLQATGHRFATISNVADYLARSIEVTRDELLPQLEKMRDYSQVCFSH